VYQAKVSPFQIQGIFEGMLWFFNQKEAGITFFGKDIDIAE
jgi:hypothetical protein